METTIKEYIRSINKKTDMHVQTNLNLKVKKIYFTNKKNIHKKIPKAIEVYKKVRGVKEIINKTIEEYYLLSIYEENIEEYIVDLNNKEILIIRWDNEIKYINV
jgi:hypothetical protein